MALIKKITNNFASIRGVPTSDTDWDQLQLGTDFKNLKIIVSSAALEVSFNGSDLHCVLPVGNHDFLNIGLSRLFIRKTTSSVELYGFGLEK